MDDLEDKLARHVPIGLFVTLLGFTTSACFDENRKPQKAEKEIATELSGELFDVARQRDLGEEDIRAALETYVPTGARDDYIGLMGTGTSGRIVVFGIPSMRILKYIGVFTPEPWQGFAYDDESRKLLRDSARGDIQYTYGDSGQPALSEKEGVYDALAAFVVDGANSRVAVIHLDDYETKQIVTNPVFKSSYRSVAVTPQTEFVIQNTVAPELPNGEWLEFEDSTLGSKLRGGITYWPFKRGGHTENRIDVAGAFTVELPPYVQSESDAGKKMSDGLVFTLGLCRGKGVLPGMGKDCGASDVPSVVHVIDTQRAKKIAAKYKLESHPRISLSEAAKEGILRQIDIEQSATSLAVSPNGKTAIVTHGTGESISIIDLTKVQNADWEAATPDDFGVPTLALDAGVVTRIKVGGPTADASYVSDETAYVTVREPGKLARIDLHSSQVNADIELGFAAGKLTIPHGDTAKPSDAYAIVMNSDPGNRFVSVGPVQAMNPHLVDISGGELRSLYDMAVPQSTRIEAVAIRADIVDAGTIIRYPQGTNPRSGELSEFRTSAGNERIERKGNRVHVFGTLIRSHITPEIVEIDEGDVVTFHLTNLEQAQDQTHGFTISTYNVHSSWEPGKVASVTFTADKPGVYPYYCTEFCSALHLEMMGYLLVRPKGSKMTTTLGTTASPEQLAEAKRKYDAKMQSIDETQAVIDSVVAWLKENNYEDVPQAVSLVKDATDQLNFANDIKKKIDKAVKAEDWAQAQLWAEQYYQYQVKAADAGVRAKQVVSEGGSK